LISFDEKQIDDEIYALVNKNKQDCHICKKNINFDQIVTPILSHDFGKEQHRYDKKMHVSHYDCFEKIRNIFNLPKDLVDANPLWTDYTSEGEGDTYR